MKAEGWNSRFGVILAVAGSAVGLGNFLKFPGQVAMYGGASFMLAYVVSFFILGLPIAICEWTMGRYGGANGYTERDAVLHWLETLDDRRYSVLRCDWANRRNDPPMPIFIWNR